MKRLTLVWIVCSACVTPMTEDLGPEAVALRHLCQEFSGMGDLAPEVILVNVETRPVFSTLALRYIYSGTPPGLEEGEEDLARDENLAENFSSKDIPNGALPELCEWEWLQREAKSSAGDKLRLELSGILRNPFSNAAEEELGIFAKVSSGELGGAWWWLAMKRSGQGWHLVRSVSLDVSEN
ncbi:MAG: hypothetical protein AAF604_20095 [Acidobacteriota bacterium]